MSDVGDSSDRGQLWVGALFGTFLVCITLAYWPGLEQPGRVPREALLLLGTPVLLGVALLKRRSCPSILPVSALSVALLSGVLHVIFAAGPERLGVARDLAVMAAPWAVALAAMLAAGERLDAAIEAAAVTALLALSFLGLAQGWLGWDVFAQKGSPAATFVNRNVAAQLLLGLIPLVMPALFFGAKWWIRWTAALSGGTGVAFLVATRTRGAWIGAAAAALLGGVFWIVHCKRFRVARQVAAPFAAALGLGVAALVIPVTEGPERLPSVPERLGDLLQPLRGTGAIRLALIQNSTAMTLDHPWGVGPGRFVVVYPLYNHARRETPLFGTTYQPEHPHNDLLEYAADLGLPAALALMLFFGGALACCFRGAAAVRSQRDLLRRAARAASLTGVVVHGLVSFPLHSPASAFVGFLVAGRCWSYAGRTCGPSARSHVLAALVFALIPLGIWAGNREMRSQWSLHEGLRAHASADCGRALDRSDKVFHLAFWKRRDLGTAAMIRFRCTSEDELATLERALALHPHRLELLLATGARRLKAGHADEAQAAFLHAAEVLPDHAPAWLGLAMARLKLGDRLGAKEACERTLQLDLGLEPARTFCADTRLVPKHR